MSFIPFLNITLSGIVAILLVALVVGLINAFIVPAVKGLFKKANALVLFIVSVIIDALALMLGAWVVGDLLGRDFSIGFWPGAIIVALVLSVFNVGFDRVNKK